MSEFAYSYRPYGAAMQLMGCRAPEVLMVGPAGTGKTRAVLQKLHAVAEKYPACRILILREFRIALNETVLVTFESKVLPPKHAALEGPDRNHRARYEYRNGSEIVLGGLDQPERFMSGEYDIAYLAEGTDVRDEGKWEMVLSRLRNGKVPYQQGIVDCNPVAQSHWLNQRAERKRAGGAPVMVRLLSLHSDNPTITPEYLQVLSNLTGVRRARLFEGKWCGAEGLIYDFERTRHVRIPDWTKHPKRIIVGCDDGFRNPFACLRALVSGDNDVHIDAERYESGLLEAAKVSAIARLGEGADRIVVDPAAAGLIEACNRANVQAGPADNDVLAGIAAVQQLFGSNRITISPGCVKLIGEIEGYEWADNDKRDQPVKENDHACDGLRYLTRALGEQGSSVSVGYEDAPIIDPNCDHNFTMAHDGTMRCQKCRHRRPPSAAEMETALRDRWLNEV